MGRACGLLRLLVCGWGSSEHNALEAAGEKLRLFLKTSGWKWAIQPLSAVERTVERVPGRWPLSSPRRRRRWPEGQALQGRSAPGYNPHQRTDGLRFKTSRSRQASCRALHHPFEIQQSLFTTCDASTNSVATIARVTLTKLSPGRPSSIDNFCAVKSTRRSTK